MIVKYSHLKKANDSRFFGMFVPERNFLSGTEKEALEEIFHNPLKVPRIRGYLGAINERLIVSDLDIRVEDSSFHMEKGSGLNSFDLKQEILFLAFLYRDTPNKEGIVNYCLKISISEPFTRFGGEIVRAVEVEVIPTLDLPSHLHPLLKEKIIQWGGVETDPEKDSESTPEKDMYPVPELTSKPLKAPALELNTQVLDKIRQITNAISGKAHSTIENQMKKLFLVSDADIQKYLDGVKLTPTKTIQAILAILYQANLEVAAKEGDANEVEQILQTMYRDKALGAKDLQALIDKTQGYLEQ